MLKTFMTVREAPLLRRLDVAHPQVIIIDEGNERGVTGRDLRVHACPRALTLDFHRLHGCSLLNIT